MDLYYNYDLSLSEIAEHTNTSRQAVYDIIKRCYKLLVQYEEKLGLLNKRIQLKKQVCSILNMLDRAKNSDNKSIIEKIKRYIIDNI